MVEVYERHGKGGKAIAFLKQGLERRRYALKGKDRGDRASKCTLGIILHFFEKKDTKNANKLIGGVVM